MATVKPVNNDNNGKSEGPNKPGKGYMSAPEFEHKWKDELGQKIMNDSMKRTKQFIESMSGEDDGINTYS